MVALHAAGLRVIVAVLVGFKLLLKQSDQIADVLQILQFAQLEFDFEVSGDGCHQVDVSEGIPVGDVGCIRFRR